MKPSEPNQVSASETDIQNSVQATQTAEAENSVDTSADTPTMRDRNNRRLPRVEGTPTMKVQS